MTLCSAKAPAEPQVIVMRCSLSGSGWDCGPAGALCAWSTRRPRSGMEAHAEAQCALSTIMASFTSFSPFGLSAIECSIHEL